MSRYHAYLNAAISLVKSYPAGSPFPYHSKAFFAKHKKYGSRDRKLIVSYCYAYFRAFHLSAGYTDEERICLGVFLQEKESNPFLSAFKPEWDAKMATPIQEKLALIGKLPVQVFPFHEAIGSLKDKEQFYLSVLQQPDLFIRIRPKKFQKVISLLDEAAIPYHKISETSLRFINSAPIDKILSLNKDAVIQDLSSQKVFEQLPQLPAQAKVWDCCAASGGKSILLSDVQAASLKLTVSDIRESTLQQLRARFKEAGINVQRIAKADLTLKDPLPRDELFSLIVADLPCTGSGTWARTPEQLAGFNQSSIAAFSHLQYSIVQKVLPHLAPEGMLIYITCSVFRNENEENVSKILANTGLKLVQQYYIEGSADKADSMFVAIMKR